jgi:lysophospholipase L1-like esterase
MTIDISDNNPRVSYTVASGVTQTSFVVPFEFFSDDDLNVYVNDVLKTITTDYTVTGGDGSTGSITMSVTGLATVVIVREISIERTTDFPTGIDINRAALNTQLDTLTAISADLNDKINRSVRLGESSTSAVPTLPEPDSGKVIAWTASGGLTNISADIGDIAADVVAAEAAKVAAETAQANAEIAETNAETAETGAEAAKVAAETAQVGAELAQANAETARDAAFVNADVYADTAAGIAGTTVGDQFQVIDGDEIVRYSHDSGPVATEVARYPSADYVFDRLDPDLSSLSGYEFGLVDGDGRLAIGVRVDGSVSMPGTPAFNAAEDTLTGLSDVSWGILDQDGRFALGLTKGGNVLAKGEEIDLGGFASTVNDLSDQLYPASTVDCWGDSLTHGNTVGVTTPYPTALAALLTDRTVNNKGLTGRTSLQIGTAFGAVPSLLTVTSNTIPASGSVSVTTTENGNFSTKSNVGTINVVGELFGISGTLAVSYNASDPNLAGTSTFTRSISGTETLIPNNTPFIPNTNSWEKNTVVIWSGRNDIISYKSGNTLYDNDFILGNIAAMVEFLSPLRKRFIVLTVTDSSSEYVGAASQVDEDAFLQILALNKEIMRLYPRNAIDVRKILVNSYDSGEPADVTAFSRDQVPPSLQQDGLHLNDAGYAIVAQAVSDFINAKGW